MEIYKTDSHTSVDTSCKKIGIAISTFYQRKYLTEMLLTDLQAFDALKEKAVKEKKFLASLNKECKVKLYTSPYKHIAKEMRADGKLLS